MNFLFRNILWVDCLGAIATGILLIALSSTIGPLYGLSTSLVIGHGFVHLAYGSYSLSLAVRKTRPLILIKLLAFANAGWAVFCAYVAAQLVGGDSVFAAVHFLIEGIYVGGLASIEWNRRNELSGKSSVL